MLDITTVAEFLFWLCSSTLFYVYFGYPLLLDLLSRVAPRARMSAEHFEAPVTLLVSAYNESLVISSKLENTLLLNYPKELLEVIVISDCSDDGTDEIVERYSQHGVLLIRQQSRLGKTAGLNLAVPQARGEILVFSDANALYQSDAIRMLVRHFSDPKVGYVVGNARYVEKAAVSQSAAAEGLYWKLETWLKNNESRFGSVVGGDGAIYAIRRELYSPLLPTDINDFLNPLQIVVRGYDGVFEPAAISYEETAESFAKEFRRKVRIVSRSLNATWRVPGVLNPFGKSRHWILLVSHKILRWFAPLFMILLLFASLWLWNSPFYRVAALFQLAFYALALVGWARGGQHSTWRMFSLPFYFCLVNLASLIGCFKCMRGDLAATWMPPRGNVQSKA